MNRIKKFFRSERGDAEVVEAAILYPVTFMLIFLLIYIGLYILQMMTVSAYAQKVALLAAREVSSPGYQTLLDQSRYSTSAAEADFNLSVDTENKGKYYEKINIDNKVKNVKAKAYRYWGNCLPDEDAKYYKQVLENLVRSNSIINAGEGRSVTVTIKSKNYFISQFIDVSVEQELMDFPVLAFFGIKNPTVTGSATATVSDTDELVRTTDFAVDSIKALANHLGIDTTEIKSKVVSVLEDLNLI